MHNPAGYAYLAEKANATYLETKGAMSVGYARQRFSYKEMARHEEIRDFAIKISLESGYQIRDEQFLSSVVLLSKKK
jgi:tRNA wybutosine-synthesizing protein 1